LGFPTRLIVRGFEPHPISRFEIESLKLLKLGLYFRVGFHRKTRGIRIWIKRSTLRWVAREKWWPPAPNADHTECRLRVHLRPGSRQQQIQRCPLRPRKRKRNMQSRPNQLNSKRRGLTWCRAVTPTQGIGFAWFAKVTHARHRSTGRTDPFVFYPYGRRIWISELTPAPRNDEATPTSAT